MNLLQGAEAGNNRLFAGRRWWLTGAVVFGAVLLQVAERAGVHSTDVKNVIIWGNHSSTQVGCCCLHEGPGAVSVLASQTSPLWHVMLSTMVATILLSAAYLLHRQVLETLRSRGPCVACVLCVCCSTPT